MVDTVMMLVIIMTMITTTYIYIYRERERDISAPRASLHEIKELQASNKAGSGSRV